MYELEMEFLMSMHSSALSVRVYITSNSIEHKGLTRSPRHPVGTHPRNLTNDAGYAIFLVRYAKTTHV